MLMPGGKPYLQYFIYTECVPKNKKQRLLFNSLNFFISKTSAFLVYQDVSIETIFIYCYSFCLEINAS